MKLIVGLGNPGEKYKNTRHNIGFYFIDLLNERNNFGNWKFDKKYKSEIINYESNGKKTILCKPQTYMNLSGEAVAPLANFYKIETQNILVLHDEIDFVTGRVSLKFGGSSAGHNGLKSIIEKLGTRDFWRLRIGVDRPTINSQVVDWVLSSFKIEERKNLIEKEEEIFKLIGDFLDK